MFRRCLATSGKILPPQSPLSPRISAHGGRGNGAGLRLRAVVAHNPSSVAPPLTSGPASLFEAAGVVSPLLLHLQVAFSLLTRWLRFGGSGPSLRIPSCHGGLVAALSRLD
jgi:hypothetical protein